MKIKIVLGFLFAILFIGEVAYAHSFGLSLESNSNGHLIDVGYDVIQDITTDFPVRFAFDLWRDTGKIEVEPFTSVWVQIIGPDKRVVFAGTIAQPEFGFASMTYRFPKSGEYALSVRYEKDSTDIATSTFRLIVKSGEKYTTVDGLSGALPLIIGVLVGATLVFFIRQNKK